MGWGRKDVGVVISFYLLSAMSRAKKMSFSSSNETEDSVYQTDA